MTRFTSLLLIALVLVVAARAQTNSRPCSAQAAAMQPRKPTPTLSERVAELEKRVAELEKVCGMKGAE